MVHSETQWQIAAFALEETVKNRYTQTLEMATAPWWWVVTVILVMCVPVQFVIAAVKTAGAVTGRPPRHTDIEDSI